MENERYGNQCTGDVFHTLSHRYRRSREQDGVERASLFHIYQGIKSCDNGEAAMGVIFDNVEFILGDCIEYLRKCEDDSFDLAIVDPPYGLTTDGYRFNGSRYKRYRKECHIEWDTAPSKEYFDELFRVSKRQIIFGVNFFALPPTKCFIVWDKKIPQQFSFGQAEYAWTSFQDRNSKIYRHAPQGTKKHPRIHPTQKPIGLYNWIYDNFSEENWRVLDTHLGSGSNAISAHGRPIEFVGIEINEYYYSKSIERFREEVGIWANP